MPVENNTHNSGNNFPGYSFKRGRVLPSGALLYRLFFQPQVLLGLREDRWQRPFRMITLICVTGGIAIGLARTPALLKTGNEWSTWLRDTVQELRLENGRVSWKKPRDVPKTIWHKTWAISFNPEDSTFQKTEIEQQRDHQEKGIWINPSSVYAWWTTPRDSIHPVTLIKEGKLRGALDMEKVWPEGLILRGEKFEEFIHSFLLILIPAVMIQEAFLLLITVGFYTAIFALIPVILRTPFWSTRAFGNIFGFYLYAAIPALLATALYRCLNLKMLGISGTFVLCFVAYLFLAFYNIHREYPPQNSPRQ